MGKTFEALQHAEEERRFREAAPGGNNHFPGRLKATVRTAIEHSRLKRNILRLISGTKGKALMFSSATSREGTTSVLIDFAHSLAQDGERVLLVDANLRSPSLHAVFGLAGENGITDLLQGKTALKEAMKQTSTPHISVVTCGCTHPNPYVMLEWNIMKDRVEEMKSKAEWVLFDSPPVTCFNDAAAMAPNFDGVVLVVEAEKTRWEVAENARNCLVNGQGNVLGVVLNKRKYPIPNWIYKRV